MPEKVRPEMYAWVDEGEKNYLIETKMPGVEKKDVKLDVYDALIQVTSDGDSYAYRGYLHLPLKIEPKGTTATFKNGILRVTAPLSEKLGRPVKVEIK